MNKINLNVVSAGLRFPFKRGTMDFLQNSYTEVFNEIVKREIGSYLTSSGIVYVLSGCERTDASGTTTISAGYVFYNGVIYLSPQQSFASPAGSDVVYATIQTTQYVGNGVDADPVEFSDGNNYNVHNIITIKYNVGISGSGIANYTSFFFVDKWRDGGTPSTGADFIITAPDVIYNRYLIKGNILYWNLKILNATIQNTPSVLRIDLPSEIYNTFGREIDDTSVLFELRHSVDGTLDLYTPIICRYSFNAGFNRVYVVNMGATNFTNGTNNKAIEIYATIQLK